MRVSALLMSGFQSVSQTFCHASFASSGTTLPYQNTGTMMLYQLKGVYGGHHSE
jgi:hypothetical protein